LRRKHDRCPPFLTLVRAPRVGQVCTSYRAPRHLVAEAARTLNGIISFGIKEFQATVEDDRA